MRYYIATLVDIGLWPMMLAKMIAALNNSIKYLSTALAPTQILYKFKIREALDLLRLEEPEAKAIVENDVNVITAHPVTRARARRAR